jgi:hypothetical protein
LIAVWIQDRAGNVPRDFETEKSADEGANHAPNSRSIPAFVHGPILGCRAVQTKNSNLAELAGRDPPTPITSSKSSEASSRQARSSKKAVPGFDSGHLGEL